MPAAKRAKQLMGPSELVDVPALRVRRPLRWIAQETGHRVRANANQRQLAFGIRQQLALGGVLPARWPGLASPERMNVLRTSIASENFQTVQVHASRRWIARGH